MKTIRNDLLETIASLPADVRLKRLDNILSMCEPIPFCGCYVWPFWSTGKGHGNVSIERRTVKVHRLTWTLKHGVAPPPGQVLDHNCRVRSCANPDHTTPRTVKENTDLGQGVHHQFRAVAPALSI